MRWFYFYLLIIFLSTGCSNTSDNTLKDEAPAFTIKMAPSFAPAANTPVPVNSTLLLEVSKPLDPSTVNGTTVYLQNVTGEHLPASVVYVNSNENPNIVITPAIYLLPQTTYEIIVSTEVTTTEGEQLSQKASIPFTSDVSIDSTPPTLVTTLPLANATPEPFGIIYFQFNENLSPFLDQNLLRVYDNNGDISGSTKFAGAFISFTPNSNLSNSTQYFVELNTSSITDLSSNSYVGSELVDFNFTVIDSGNQKPLIHPSEVDQTLIINSTVNCIKPLSTTITAGLQPDLYIGTESGLKIVTFTLNTTDFNASTFSVLASLNTKQVGIVYDIDLNITTHRAYLASSQGIYILNINNSNHPVILNHFPISDANNINVPAYGLDQVGSHIYVAATTEGLIDLNISNENNITEIFRADTNGTAFDVELGGTSLYTSDYDNVIKAFDMSANPVTIPVPLVFSRTHNLFTYYHSASGTRIIVAAGGISGLSYVDINYGFDSDAIPTPSYTSKVIHHDTNISNSFAVLKDLGIVYFTPYSPYLIADQIITNYHLLPYNISAAGYMAYPNEGYSVIFVAEDNGTVHAFLIP